MGLTVFIRTFPRVLIPPNAGTAAYAFVLLLGTRLTAFFAIFTRSIERCEFRFLSPA